MRLFCGADFQSAWQVGVPPRSHYKWHHTHSGWTNLPKLHGVQVRRLHNEPEADGSTRQGADVAPSLPSDNALNFIPEKLNALR